MNDYEFSKVCGYKDPERAIEIVFDEAHDKWTTEGRSGLTEGQLTVLAVETFFGEVLNGGFYQYFSNESGGLSLLAPNALRRVGLDAYATVLQPFLALFPDATPAEDTEVRQSQLDGIADRYDEEKFEKMEEPFWDLIKANKREFRTKLFDYIMANRSQFVA